MSLTTPYPTNNVFLWIMELFVVLLSFFLITQCVVLSDN